VVFAGCAVVGRLRRVRPGFVFAGKKRGFCRLRRGGAPAAG